MLNVLKRHTKTKPKLTVIFKNCSYTVVHNTAQKVLIIFPFILQTIVIAEMMSAGAEGGL